MKQVRACSPLMNFRSKSSLNDIKPPKQLNQIQNKMEVHNNIAMQSYADERTFSQRLQQRKWQNSQILKQDAELMNKNLTDDPENLKQSLYIENDQQTRLTELKVFIENMLELDQNDALFGTLEGDQPIVQLNNQNEIQLNQVNQVINNDQEPVNMIKDKKNLSELELFSVAFDEVIHILSQTPSNDSYCSTLVKIKNYYISKIISKSSKEKAQTAAVNILDDQVIALQNTIQLLQNQIEDQALENYAIYKQIEKYRSEVDEHKFKAKQTSKKLEEQETEMRRMQRLKDLGEESVKSLMKRVDHLTHENKRLEEQNAKIHRDIYMVNNTIEKMEKQQVKLKQDLDVSYGQNVMLKVQKDQLEKELAETTLSYKTQLEELQSLSLSKEIVNSSAFGQIVHDSLDLFQKMKQSEALLVNIGASSNEIETLKQLFGSLKNAKVSQAVQEWFHDNSWAQVNLNSYGVQVGIELYKAQQLAQMQNNKKLEIPTGKSLQPIQLKNVSELSNKTQDTGRKSTINNDSNIEMFEDLVQKKAEEMLLKMKAKEQKELEKALLLEELNAKNNSEVFEHMRNYEHKTMYSKEELDDIARYQDPDRVAQLVIDYQLCQNTLNQFQIDKNLLEVNFNTSKKQIEAFKSQIVNLKMLMEVKDTEVKMLRFKLGPQPELNFCMIHYQNDQENQLLTQEEIEQNKINSLIEQLARLVLFIPKKVRSEYKQLLMDALFKHKYKQQNQVKFQRIFQNTQKLAQTEDAKQVEQYVLQEIEVFDASLQAYSDFESSSSISKFTSQSNSRTKFESMDKLPKQKPLSKSKSRNSDEDSSQTSGKKLFKTKTQQLKNKEQKLKNKNGKSKENILNDNPENAEKIDETAQINLSTVIETHNDVDNKGSVQYKPSRTPKLQINNSSGGSAVLQLDSKILDQSLTDFLINIPGDKNQEEDEVDNDNIQLFSEQQNNTIKYQLQREIKNISYHVAKESSRSMLRNVKVKPDSTSDNIKIQNEIAEQQLQQQLKAYHEEQQKEQSKQYELLQQQQTYLHEQQQFLEQQKLRKSVSYGTIQLNTNQQVEKECQHDELLIQSQVCNQYQQCDEEIKKLTISVDAAVQVHVVEYNSSGSIINNSNQVEEQIMEAPNDLLPEFLKDQSKKPLHVTYQQIVDKITQTDQISVNSEFTQTLKLIDQFYADDVIIDDILKMKSKTTKENIEKFKVGSLNNVIDDLELLQTEQLGDQTQNNVSQNQKDEQVRIALAQGLKHMKNNQQQNQSDQQTAQTQAQIDQQATFAKMQTPPGLLKADLEIQNRNARHFNAFQGSFTFQKDQYGNDTIVQQTSGTNNSHKTTQSLNIDQTDILRSNVITPQKVLTSSCEIHPKYGNFTRIMKNCEDLPQPEQVFVPHLLDKVYLKYMPDNGRFSPCVVGEITVERGLQTKEAFEHESSMSTEVKRFDNQLIPKLSEGVSLVRLSALSLQQNKSIPYLARQTFKTYSSQLYLQVNVKNTYMKTEAWTIRLIREILQKRINAKFSFIIKDQLPQSSFVTEPDQLLKNNFKIVQGQYNREEAESISSFAETYFKQKYGSTALSDQLMNNLIANMAYWQYFNNEIYMFCRMFFNDLEADVQLSYIELKRISGFTNISTQPEKFSTILIPELTQSFFKNWGGKRQYALMQRIYAALYSMSDGVLKIPEHTNFQTIAEMLLFTYLGHRKAIFSQLMVIFKHISKDEKLNIGGFRQLMELTMPFMQKSSVEEWFFIFSVGQPQETDLTKRFMTYDNFVDFFQSGQVARFCVTDSDMLDKLVDIDVKKYTIHATHVYENMRPVVKDLIKIVRRRAENEGGDYIRKAELMKCYIDVTKFDLMAYDYEHAVISMKAIFGIAIECMIKIMPDCSVVAVGGAMTALKQFINAGMV
ncbi:Conserved_hypothetical protein [Hexamita inflata]|uniref:Uncharacterized protein n=1 Tax=Hexamita inflata TaxID=28002 RepID=A0AA86PLD7_9EUKA|nr:Conserved hypothetical protein [Hexamita inflata]